MGVRVIVTPRNDGVTPQQFDHPSLVALATKPATPDVAAPTPAPTTPTMEKTELPLPTYSSLSAPTLPGQPRAALGEGIDASATPRCRPPRLSHSTSSLPTSVPRWLGPAVGCTRCPGPGRSGGLREAAEARPGVGVR